MQPALTRYTRIAQSRLPAGAQSELPAIQAWRRALARMGLEPTQYRCASEALLRRLRKEGYLPRLHPLVDLCNAVSVAYAIPIAVFDMAQVAGTLQVRHTTREEDYLSFSGEHELPDAGEVIFADEHCAANKLKAFRRPTDSTAALERACTRRCRGSRPSARGGGRWPR